MTVRLGCGVPPNGWTGDSCKQDLRKLGTIIPLLTTLAGLKHRNLNLCSASVRRLCMIFIGGTLGVSALYSRHRFFLGSKRGLRGRGEGSLEQERWRGAG